MSRTKNPPIYTTGIEAKIEQALVTSTERIARLDVLSQRAKGGRRQKLLEAKEAAEIQWGKIWGDS